MTTYQQLSTFLETLRKSKKSGFHIESVSKDVRGIDVSLYNSRRCRNTRNITVTLSFEHGVASNAVSINNTSMKRGKEIDGVLFAVSPKYRKADDLPAVFIPFVK